MFQPNARYPDPSVHVLHEDFNKYRLMLASVEQLYTGCRWSEGPVWFGDGRYLLWSDIPNNRILKWEEETGAVSVFRKPSDFANGNTATARAGWSPANMAPGASPAPNPTARSRC
jgi:gluconolactonase